MQLEAACDIIPAIYDPDVPNHQYAAPNKFYEALMLGKPLIMVQNTGMDHFVRQYDLGEIIEYSSESLTRALIELSERKSEFAEIFARMKKLYDEQFSWDEMERRLIVLYKNLF